MNKRLLQSVGLVALGAVLGGGLTYFTASPAPETAQNTDSVAAVGEILPLREGVTTSISADTNRYTNDRHSFTLDYPKELALKEIDEGSNAMTVVFQKPGEQVGFQMFIVPYAGETISESRIQQDLKGATMANPTEIILPGNIRAVHFTSNSPIIGESTEVWFIHEGHLYEVTTYSELDSWLATILSTIEFK